MTDRKEQTVFKGTLDLRNDDRSAHISWRPALELIDTDDYDKGFRRSETRIEIVVKSSTIGKVAGKRTRYTGDLEKLAEVIKRYEARGFRS